MKKIQGTLITCLLTIAILTSMPLAPAQETKEQGRRVITAINDHKLEKPIPLSKFFKQVQEKKSKKGEGVNDAEVKAGRSGGRVKKPRERKKTSSQSNLSL
ncbi:MAG: hypothetical protein GWO20_05225 [Candidatus Korarchaeota archaeon]|nr:hypothetical protein [Candidatus Korarchaeota archaeon]NIU82828.1 hypothetical protein [Candidatus Thorarchaeota archaeon]NIW13314.1 hypothetical protein [Candidatus Thorarchaeota archaeon]NIW51420.1 hypothetical protein [Candidatus Korarchaeota archaeon]